MKKFLSLLLLLSVSAQASVPTRIGNDAIFSGYANPASATGQALGSSLFKWEGYFNTINGGAVLTSASGVSTSRLINTSSPLTGGGDLSADRTIAIPAGSSTVNGYITSADWTSFFFKAASTITFTPAAPLTGGGNLSANRTLSIARATSAVDGYLAGSDFNSFSTKAASTVTLTANAPITGGGDLSTNRSFSIAKATGSVDGYLAGADFNTFSTKAASTVTITANSPLTGGGDLSTNRSISLPQGSSTANGYITSADWTSFFFKAASTITLTTNSPLTGGGDLSANRSISLPQGSSTANGYITSADWTSFFFKAASTITISTTAPITGGGNLSANRTFAIPQATSSVDGYLSQTDWSAFNNKQAAITASLPLSLSGGALSIAGSSTVNGDAQTWSGVKTFNSLPKFPAGIQFQAANGASIVTMKAGNSLLTSYTIMVPPNMGTNGYVLQTDGQSVTSWVAQSGGGGSVPTSIIMVSTGNGHGSSSVDIRRYTTIVINSGGSDISYADSSTLGAQFTINTTGNYCAFISDRDSGGAFAVGATVNATGYDGAQAIDASTNALGRLSLEQAQEVAFISSFGCRSITAGQIIHPHDDAGPDSADHRGFFYVMRMN